ncbi:MAG: MMPL family transporter, partial [Candidatus Hydrogenedentes bacterium]|nr:MMPL family transporter [Candidatus Hydrogenedentota bacterium]
MKLSESVTRISLDRPRMIAVGILALCVVIGLTALLPSVWPASFPALNGVRVDTDPENMLSSTEAVRVFHDDMKRVFSLNDIVVLGVVNESDPEGVFNPESLRKIYDLTQYALTLHGDVIGQEDPQAGVIRADVLAPSTVDNIEQGGPGVVRFEWLMASPPTSEADAVAVRDKARRIPFLDGTLLSESGKALCLYLPLTSKDLSYSVYMKLREKIAGMEGEERFFITGLPVANDTFGHQMFVQMAISAPMAMVVIFLLMLLFFRKLVLIVSPMIIAMAAVICTMGLLVATGNTIHIMSSMIPIFIMPIAVLDSIHILSEFFDRYQQTRDRRKTMLSVMESLSAPMLYTSLTSSAGFASLALTPIPPVQIFGLFVAFGIMLAWFFTITFIPAYVMFIPEKRLENFGMADMSAEEGREDRSLVGRFLHLMGYFTFRHAKSVVVLSVVVLVLSVVGMGRIRINDNPTNWFKYSHPIRVADRVLNEHFGGTYMAYLVLRAPGETAASALRGVEEPAGASLTAPAVPALPAGLGGPAEPTLPAGLGGSTSVLAPEIVVEAASMKEEVFKDPAVLRYMRGLQEHLLTTGVVGKSNSLADIVKTVHRE